MAHELTQEGVNMGETRGRDCATAGVRAEASGGVEGVWVQRAAGKSDCGEAGGGGVDGGGGCREGRLSFWTRESRLLVVVDGGFGVRERLR